jgi:hypothetical protein
MTLPEFSGISNDSGPISSEPECDARLDDRLRNLGTLHAACMAPYHKVIGIVDARNVQALWASCRSSSRSCRASGRLRR